MKGMRIKKKNALWDVKAVSTPTGLSVSSSKKQLMATSVVEIFSSS